MWHLAVPTWRPAVAAGPELALPKKWCQIIGNAWAGP